MTTINQILARYWPTGELDAEAAIALRKAAVRMSIVLLIGVVLYFSPSIANAVLTAVGSLAIGEAIARVVLGIATAEIFLVEHDITMGVLLLSSVTLIAGTLRNSVLAGQYLKMAFNGNGGGVSNAEELARLQKSTTGLAQATNKLFTLYILTVVALGMISIIAIPGKFTAGIDANVYTTGWHLLVILVTGFCGGSELMRLILVGAPFPGYTPNGNYSRSYYAALRGTGLSNYPDAVLNVLTILKDSNKND